MEINLKVALIPWDESVVNNNIYVSKNENWHTRFRRAFKEKGILLNTVDVYQNIEEIDWFLFFALDYDWLYKVIKNGKAGNMIYCSAEPEVVKPENSKHGYENKLKVFPYIMTWNDDLIDEIRIFKRCIPYDFGKEYGTMEFAEKKLLVNISGNKHSFHKKELYSEREKVIEYFEKKCKEEVGLYGQGWDIKTHPSYKGICQSKSEVYHEYKFALCLENTYGIKGYITEKIFDCFKAGIVPIYWGATDILEYVPAQCFIDYSSFENLEDLYLYLKNMPERRYNEYLKEIDNLLNTDIQKNFSSELFVDQIVKIFLLGGKEKYKVTFDVKLKILIGRFKSFIEKKWLMFKLEIKKNLKHRGQL